MEEREQEKNNKGRKEKKGVRNRGIREWRNEVLEEERKKDKESLKHRKNNE